MTSGDSSIADSSTVTSSEASSPSSEAVDAFGTLWEDDSSTVPESKPESHAASSTISESPVSSQKTAPNSKAEEPVKNTSPSSAPAKKPFAPPASSKESAPPVSSERTDPGKAESSVTTGNDFQTTQSYVLNTNTKKFHRSSCSDVKRIKPENYATCNSRSEAIDSGYVPCKRCKP